MERDSPPAPPRAPGHPRRADRLCTTAPRRSSSSSQALARASRSSEAVAVLFVDLDDFKRANDTHGHGGRRRDPQADRRAAGPDAARRGDFVARLGGDEFVVIAEGVGDGSRGDRDCGDTARGGGQRAGRGQATCGSPWGRASAWRSRSTDADDEPSQLLARADLAVYRAKQAGQLAGGDLRRGMQRALIARAERRAGPARRARRRR